MYAVDRFRSIRHDADRNRMADRFQNGGRADRPESATQFDELDVLIAHQTLRDSGTFCRGRDTDENGAAPGVVDHGDLTCGGHPGSGVDEAPSSQ